MQTVGEPLFICKDFNRFYHGCTQQSDSSFVCNATEKLFPANLCCTKVDSSPQFSLSLFISFLLSLENALSLDVCYISIHLTIKLFILSLLYAFLAIFTRVKKFHFKHFHMVKIILYLDFEMWRRALAHRHIYTYRER